ncbi:MAG: S1 RNA-binding domain-containing protein [Lachnospiraceae bacterium]|nr:S1 RNA-binding domain-containing protein [Lachnospiraceae bacterium]
MIRLGEVQDLVIVKKVEFGVYVAPESAVHDSEAVKEQKILLPSKYVPEGNSVGDHVKVFVYRDSKDRLVATTLQPKLAMGQVARLRVAQVGKFGAFLDWGLEKDLMLPFKQQKKRVSEGEDVLVSLYIDKSDRLCATMNVYHDLRTDSPYQKDDRVTGTVYEISPNFGAFVAVDDIYSGLIAQKELYGDVRIGETITARVLKVKEDGKLDLSIREKAYLQIAGDAEKVAELIDRFGGALPFNDKASPEVIKRETGMSKNEFKRAVGNLLKNGRIKITEKGILKISE